MELENIKGQLRELTIRGLEAISQSSFGVEGCKKSNAYFDYRKDELITSLDSFESSVDALGKVDTLRNLFGEESKRIAIQFVFNSCAPLANGSSPETAFDQVWECLKQELATPTWTYRSVANLQNIVCNQDSIDMLDGMSIRGRSFEELSILLNWGPTELDYLTKDWMEGVSSSYVLLVESFLPKTPENFLLSNDSNTHTNTNRLLLAMRLVDSGDVRIGKVFMTKPNLFNVCTGGMQSSGYSHWHPGPNYELTVEKASTIQEIYKELSTLDSQNNRTIRTLSLALRSFSSIYDRRLHESEDRIVDAITSLEALWQLDIELSFKLAFRTSSLLSTSDEERISIFETLTNYYKIRSKIVHGGLLNESHERLLRADEPLREIVRRTLRAFLYLAINPAEWTLERLYKEADITLMHTANRAALQVAMGTNNKQ